MKKIFDRQNFIDIVDRNSGRIYSDMEFRHCYFESCNISITLKPKNCSQIRNIELLIVQFEAVRYMLRLLKMYWLAV